MSADFDTVLPVGLTPVEALSPAVQQRRTQLHLHPSISHPPHLTPQMYLPSLVLARPSAWR